MHLQPASGPHHGEVSGLSGRERAECAGHRVGVGRRRATDRDDHVADADAGGLRGTAGRDDADFAAAAGGVLQSDPEESLSVLRERCGAEGERDERELRAVQVWHESVPCSSLP